MSLVQDAVRRVREQLNDTDPSNYRWSDAEILDYINDGLRQTVILKPESNLIEYLFTPADEASLQKLPADAVKFVKALFNKETTPPP